MITCGLWYYIGLAIFFWKLACCYSSKLLLIHVNDFRNVGILCCCKLWQSFMLMFLQEYRVLLFAWKIRILEKGAGWNRGDWRGVFTIFLYWRKGPGGNWRWSKGRVVTFAIIKISEEGTGWNLRWLTRSVVIIKIDIYLV